MRKGSKHTIKSIEKMRENSLRLKSIPPSQKGKTFPNRKRPIKGLKRVPASNEKKLKIRLNLQGRFKGENSPNWKGGLTSINNQIRGSANYKLWRKSIFQRDNFTCQKYRIRGGELVAHHINNFADFPELQLALDNGITLSEKAHREFHKIYGKTNNTIEQLNEFLKSNG